MHSLVSLGIAAVLNALHEFWDGPHQQSDKTNLFTNLYYRTLDIIQLACTSDATGWLHMYISKITLVLTDMHRHV